MKILAAYASKHGSTAEVAETIAGALGEHGHSVVLRSAAEVTDIGDYDAVVLGGALYMGRLHRDARGFLHRHRDALRARPFAAFAMGPLTLDDTDVRGSRTQLERALRHERELQPRSTAVFGGVVDPAELHFPFNRMPASDARDWNAVRAWAAQLAADFQAAQTGAPHGNP